MILKRFISTIIYIILFILLLAGINYSVDRGYIAKVNAEAKFSCIITIFVFGLGLLVQSFGQKIKQFNKDKQLKRVIMHNLQTNVKGLDLQLNNFSSVLMALKSPRPDGALLYSYAELDYFEINNFNSEDLYRIFIDYSKGNEKDNIDNLENLRKQIRFIESSKNDFLGIYEKLFTSIRDDGNSALDGIRELGRFHDYEATRLENQEKDINEDIWFINFSNLLGQAYLVLRTNDESITDFNQLEEQIIPSFTEFFKNNIKDLRTPIVDSFFNKTITYTFQRKDTIKNLINLVDFYSQKYQEAKDFIESALIKYGKY
ncbi:MAG: hypothetical protein ACM3O3_03590 [Syntrophothermus sp.]